MECVGQVSDTQTHGAISESLPGSGLSQEGVMRAMRIRHQSSRGVARRGKGVPQLQRVLSLVLVGFMVMVGTAPANAADGQMIKGDGDFAGHVVADSSDKAKVTFDTGSILSDCPTGLSGCSIEYLWRSKKNCAICWWSNDTGWLTLQAGSTKLLHCKADGAYQFELLMRLRWTAQQTKVVETSGRQERMWSLGASTLIYRLIATGFFNVSNSSGYRDTTWIETVTGTSDYSASYTIATSGSNYIAVDC